MAVEWCHGVTIADEIAFGEGPLETPTTWTDISEFVTSFSSFVGKRGERDQFGPGSATIVLKNADRRFDPTYASSPYYPDVKPMRRYRRTVTVGMTSLVVFTGYVLAWPQQWTTFDGRATVPLVDASRLLENAPLPSSTYRHEVESDDPDHYWPLQDVSIGVLDEVGNLDVSSGPGVVTVGGTESSMTASTADIGLPLGDPLAAWVYGGTPAAPAALPRSFEMWIRIAAADQADAKPLISVTLEDLSSNARGFLFYPNGTSITEEPQVNFYDPANNRRLVAGSGGDVEGVDLADGVAHHVVVTADSTTMYLYVDGQPVWSAALDTGSTAGFGLPAETLIRAGNTFASFENLPVLSHVAFYSSNLSADRIKAHYLAGSIAYGHPYSEKTGERIERALDDVGFPDALRDIDDGTVVHGPYVPNGQRLMDYLRQLEEAEQGLIYIGFDGSIRFRDRQTLWTSAQSGVVFSDDATDLAGGAIEYSFGDLNGAPIDYVSNIVTASYASIGGITRRDSTSITDYGEQALSLDTPTLPSGRAASNLAAYVLRERKEPRSTFPTVTVEFLHDPDVKIPAVVPLTPGDIVTVRRTPLDVAGEIDFDAMVVGVEHRQQGATWNVQLHLVPAPTQNTEAPYWTLDDATYGRIGAAYGNLIPG